MPAEGDYKLILHSGEARFGGDGRQRPKVYKAEEVECDNRDYSFAYPLPPYGVGIFEYDYPSEKGGFKKSASKSAVRITVTKSGKSKHSRKNK